MFKNKFKSRPLVETITVGEYLKRKREELGAELPEIAKTLGIKYEYLESLEKGDYALLPPQVYVRGFIKSYADYLHMDPQQLVRIYNRETSYAIEDEAGERRANREKKKGRWKDRLAVTPGILTGIGSLCIIAVLGYYFLHQINSFNSKPYLFIENPSADEVVKEKELWINGKTEADAILRINGQEISVDQKGGFGQKITLSEGRNILVVEAKNRFDRSDRREINIIYEAPPEDKVLVKEFQEKAEAEGQFDVVEEAPENTVTQESAGSVLGANAAAAGVEEKQGDDLEKDVIGGADVQAAGTD